MEKNPEKISKKSNSKSNNLKKISGGALISVMILSGSNYSQAKDVVGVTSQKQSIDLLKSQGQLLPNVATDYLHYGQFYKGVSTYRYHTYPYGENRQRYEADNLKDVDGKNIEIDNDVDSCNFLNETVYKANLDEIIPIIIDLQIDTTQLATGGKTIAEEYRKNIDWKNSKDFTGAGMISSVGYSHMNAMAEVLAAKKDNYTEADFIENPIQPGPLSKVGVRPGKTRLYTIAPANGGEDETPKALESIYNEAKNTPNKRYTLSFSFVGSSSTTNEGFTKLADLNNVIIFVGRNTGDMSGSTDSYGANAATIEVGYVQAPDMNVVDSKTSKLSFVGSQNDWVVPNPGQRQTGKMSGEGFCILGQWTTSESTAFLSAMAANIWAQNPDRTKDEVFGMLKRDVYKPMPGKLTVKPIISSIDGNIVYGNTYEDEVKYDSNSWNSRFGYGVVQPGKTMKENIFPEIKTSLDKKDGKYYFTISNRPAEYSVTGDGVSKDDKGYYIDLSVANPGKYTVTFVGKCNYEGKVYDFPIDRSIEIIGGLESPIAEGLSGTYRWQNDDVNTGKIWLKEFKGKLTNYTAGTSVDIQLNSVKIKNISVNTDGSFVLTSLSDYPFPFDGTDVDLKITYIDGKGNQSSTDTKLPISVLTGREDISFPELKIYPNPVMDILNIDFPYGTDNVSVKIFNTAGQLYSASNLTSDNNQIDLSSLKSGLYFVIVSDDKGHKKTEKIIKR